MSLFGKIFDFGKDLFGLGGSDGGSGFADALGDIFGGSNNLVNGLVGGGLDVASTKLQNEANKEMQTRAQAFSGSQAEIGRDWQQDIFNQSKKFNSAQSFAQFKRAKYLRETQYQTVVKDLQRAGLNPMLAYSQGGAGTPSTSAASVSGAGSAPVGHSSTYPVKGYGSAVQSASQMAQLNLQVQRMKAENKLITAQAAQTEALTDKARQDTVTSSASAGQLYMSTRELRARIGEIKAHVGKMEQEVTESAQRTDLHFAHALLADAQRDLVGKEGSKVQAQEKLVRAEAVLRGLEVPRAENEARAAKTWYGKYIAPYSGEVLKGFGSAAAVKSLFTPKFTGPSTVHKHFHRGP